MTINDPRPGRREGVKVNAVLVRETSPTHLDQPLEWLLLTSLPIASRKDVELIIEYYLQRWMIELFFKVLKSGCKIESRRFEHIDRFLPALPAGAITAPDRRLAKFVCVSRQPRVGRCQLRATLHRSGMERGVADRYEDPATSQATEANGLTRLMAGLGGYVHRKNAGPPGPQTVWLGLQIMHTIAECWLSFGPGAKTCV